MFKFEILNFTFRIFKFWIFLFQIFKFRIFKHQIIKFRNFNSKFQFQISISNLNFQFSILIRFKFLFKSKFLGFVEAPVGVLIFNTSNAWKIGNSESFSWPSGVQILSLIKWLKADPYWARKPGHFEIFKTCRNTRCDTHRDTHRDAKRDGHRDARRDGCNLGTLSLSFCQELEIEDQWQLVSSMVPRRYVRKKQMTVLESHLLPYIISRNAAQKQ